MSFHNDATPEPCNRPHAQGSPPAYSKRKSVRIYLKVESDAQQAGTHVKPYPANCNKYSCTVPADHSNLRCTPWQHPTPAIQPRIHLTTHLAAIDRNAPSPRAISATSEHSSLVTTTVVRGTVYICLGRCNRCSICAICVELRQHRQEERQNSHPYLPQYTWLRLNLWRLLRSLCCWRSRILILRSGSGGR